MHSLDLTDGGDERVDIPAGVELAETDRDAVARGRPCSSSSNLCWPHTLQSATRVIGKVEKSFYQISTWTRWPDTASPLAHQDLDGLTGLPASTAHPSGMPLRRRRFYQPFGIAAASSAMSSQASSESLSPIPAAISARPCRAGRLDSSRNRGLEQCLARWRRGMAPWWSLSTNFHSRIMKMEMASHLFSMRQIYTQRPIC